MVLRRWIRIFAIFGMFGLATALGAFGDLRQPARAATTFTVTSTGDEADGAPGDGACKTALSTCTLRAAIQEANTLAGADIIEFALGGPNPLIAPAAPLPQIANDLEIRGNTGGATRVQIDGAAAGAGANGLRACAPFVTVRHLVVSRFALTGIRADCTGITLLDNNYIGTDALGTSDSGNGGSGVVITSTGRTTISNSVISGNDAHGIDVATASSPVGASIAITNNIIGPTADGLTDIGNKGHGIGSVSAVWTQLFLIGGNIVSGNDANGVFIGINVSGAEMLGNRIGLSGAGTAMPNGSGAVNDFGINIVGDNTKIDGTQLSWGPNRVAAHSGGQIQTFISATGTVIKGNFIGTDMSGLAGLGGGVGIHLNGAGTTVGGGGPGERNVISGNGSGGITLGSSAANNMIHANVIGPGVDLVTPLGNGNGGLSGGAGIAFLGAKDNTVMANTIASNKNDGVWSNIVGSTGNELTFNSIHDNGGLGINWIGLIGADPNDAGDADAGPNNLQNYPVILSAKTNGSITVINWSLNSTPATGFRVEFFANSACDASGFGEGELLLASTAPPATDGAGNLGPMNTTTTATTVGSFITAIAAGSLSNDTSEFSACVAVTSCGADSDCDGFADVPPIVHQGPANTSASFDNCIGGFNPSQQNLSDGDFIDLSPPQAFDDLTWPNSDAMGDLCPGENDSDNDGIDDGNELFGIGCGFSTNPNVRDTDGDLFLDGAECLLATDPNDVNSKPLTSACGATTDIDGDQFIDRFEICFYNTKPSIADTDGDGCPDGVEIASINGDRKVSSIDLSQVAQNFNTAGYALPASPVNADFDVNKDGKISSIDLSKVAQLFFACS